MSTFYFVGTGIAALAGAVYLIRDGGIAGSDIVLFEESDDFGGALDAHGTAETGYFMSGSRMFESKYNCTFDLLSGIPSGTDSSISVTAETNRPAVENSWNDKARLVDLRGDITDFHRLGFSERDRADILTLLVTPEQLLDARRITDCFVPAFFQTTFWYEWCTLFAFQPWHSAIEFKRYLLRFIHHFSTIDSEQGVYRTHFKQYESIAMPVVSWLRERGVQLRFGTSARDLRFAKTTNKRVTVNALEISRNGQRSTLGLGERDFVFVTNGSMTADKAFGSMSKAPLRDRSRQSGVWRLWETVAAGRPEFGNPAAFQRAHRRIGLGVVPRHDEHPAIFETHARRYRKRRGTRRTYHVQRLELAHHPLDLPSAALCQSARKRRGMVGLRSLLRSAGKLRR